MKLEKIAFNAFNLIEDDNHDHLIEIIKSSEPVDNQDILIKYIDRNNHENYFLYNELNRKRFLELLKNEYNDRRSSEVVSVKIFKIKTL